LLLIYLPWLYFSRKKARKRWMKQRELSILRQPDEKDYEGEGFTTKSTEQKEKRETMKKKFADGEEWQIREEEEVILTRPEPLDLPPPSLKQVLCEKWWFYLLLGIADVEANYLVVKAYQYTTITSVMLLDCFSIPCVMILSFVFLRTRFRLVHYLGVVLCLGGLAILVATDAKFNEQDESKNAVIGDVLCLGGALLYAISNVGQEGAVKSFDRIEFLAMIGLFGSFLNVIQTIILERGELDSIKWNAPIVLLIVAYALCLLAMYSVVPYMLVLSGATLFNLSLLTSDVFAIIAAIFFFHRLPSVFYFVSLAVIVLGLILYNLRSQPASPISYHDIVPPIESDSVPSLPSTSTSTPISASAASASTSTSTSLLGSPSTSSSTLALGSPLASG